MSKELKTVILAYPDNPVGSKFISTFIKGNISVSAVIVEESARSSLLKRFNDKIKKDGFAGAVKRIIEVFILKLMKKRIVDYVERAEIPLYFVNKFNSTECEVLLDELGPDLIIIASAPILKPEIFSKASIGCINAHPGWLPRYRGIGANAYALLNGDKPGITVHFIDKGIDTGSIIIRETININKGDTIARINDRAVARGAELVTQVIKDIKEGRLKMSEIDEPAGPVYKAMPYSLAKQVNRSLRSQGAKKNGI
ncbi:hypothetical protein J7K93_11720 [bacterium]|nr:hypothetical protein [bacterium]